MKALERNGGFYEKTTKEWCNIGSDADDSVRIYCANKG